MIIVVAPFWTVVGVLWLGVLSYGRRLPSPYLQSTSGLNILLVKVWSLSRLWRAMSPFLAACVCAIFVTSAAYPYYRDLPEELIDEYLAYRDAPQVSVILSMNILWYEHIEQHMLSSHNDRTVIQANRRNSSTARHVNICHTSVHHLQGAGSMCIW